MFFRSASKVELAASFTFDQQAISPRQSSKEASADLHQSQNQLTDSIEDLLSNAMDFVMEYEDHMEIPKYNLSLSPPSSLSPLGDRQDIELNSKSSAEVRLFSQQ